jgi:hypothetical protein
MSSRGGAGLTIARAYVELHGGRIEVASPRMGWTHLYGVAARVLRLNAGPCLPRALRNAIMPPIPNTWKRHLP